MSATTQMLAALRAALVPLIRLGDFIGNTDEGGASGLGPFDRCAIIGQVQDAIEVGEREVAFERELDSAEGAEEAQVAATQDLGLPADVMVSYPEPENIRVGDVLTFTMPWMDNPPRTPAVCYERYEIGVRVRQPGWSLIFPNGAYCGYSLTDIRESGGRVVRHIPALAGYQFLNVHSLRRDFERGVFAPGFEPWIIKARITPQPAELADPLPEVWVLLAGPGQCEYLLFSYFPDEISFQPEEFIGLTIEEARNLKREKDKAYLQS